MCARHRGNLPRRRLYGVFQTLLIGSERVADLLDDPRIVAATLTGSEAAGRSVGAESAKHIKKTVLELGGSDPFVVMPSADLDAAVETAAKARAINNGQSCIAAKRFIVAESIADEFEKRFTAAMQALIVGDPLDERTQVGPLALEKIRDDLHGQVQATVAKGARVLTGGQPLDQPGFYYAPTVLTNISKDSPAYHEELFGPVASLFRVPDIDTAIALANDTTFGLGSAAWTNDPAEQRRFIDELEAGLVFINGMVASDPRMPFGGVKHSGYGRELGVFGIREFVNIKTVWIGGNSGKKSEAE
jgi:succinate-semialdehyde dehydrogenase/glutarate-semialdehyde dehydrogenase